MSNQLIDEESGMISEYEEKEVLSHDEAIEELEEIRALLHDAKRRINRNKLEKADIDIMIVL